MRITFVCLGNICRSPMAKYIAKDYIEKNNIINIIIDSCATHSHTKGSKMHNGTKKILEKYSINFDSHWAKPIDPKIFEQSNYVIVMDDDNKNDLIRKFGKNNKIIKITDFCDYHYNNVPDPWYTNDFEETFKILDNSVKNFFKNIIKK